MSTGQGIEVAIGLILIGEMFFNTLQTHRFHLAMKLNASETKYRRVCIGGVGRAAAEV